MNILPVRKNNRLENHDYAKTGFYFVTICVIDRHNLLWEEPNEGAKCVCLPLSPIGKIIDNEIMILSQTYEQLIVDKYVIMPNHIHMIVEIRDNSGRSQIAPTVSRAIKQFKGSVTKEIGYSIFQKSYYDHIIRDEADYLTKWNYIDTNPTRWAADDYYGPTP
ncbi:hypothetical protein AAFA46_02280 [Oscillospiraceae bacterium WX1]